MAKKNRITASRGSVNNIILNSLLSGDKYGYEIIKEVEQQTNGKIKLKQPSLYSSLKRFEEKGYIDSYWGDSDIGGRRHYYSITELGRKNATKQPLSSKQNIESKKTSPARTDEIDPAVNEFNNYVNDSVEIESINEDEYLFDFDEEDTEVSLQKQYNSFSVDDQINKLLNEESMPTDDYDEKELIDEITESVIENATDTYAEMPINNTEDNKQIDEEMVYDHHFYKQTPMTEVNEDKESDNQNELIEQKEKNYITFNDNTSIKEDKQKDTDSKSESVKPRIITDEFGITKMVYEEEQKNNPQKIFDNVKFRTAPLQNVYDNPNKNKPHKNLFEDISDEEREIKNQKFMQKFDSITQEKSSEAIFNKDYKKKLFNLYDDSFEENNNNIVEESPVFTTETKFVDPTPQTVEAEPLKSEITTSYDYTLKRVEKESNTSSFKSSYLLINKAKFVFGIIMLVVMLLQITVTLMVLKQNNLLFSKHFWVYQVSYTITALITLYYCLPVFFSPNKQASHSFRLKYSLMFGLLAFLVSLLLIYSINTFMGFEYSNAKFFLTPLIVPSVLVSNFVLGPIIFKVVTLNKKLY